MLKKIIPFLFILVFFNLSFSQENTKKTKIDEKDQQIKPVEITYIANEGVMISSGIKKS